MVSAYLADALRDPSSELQELFTSASSSATDFPQLVANHFSRVFRTDDAFQQVCVFVISLDEFLYDFTIDPCSEFKKSSRSTPPSIPCEVPWHGARYVSIFGNVPIQIARWESGWMGDRDGNCRRTAPWSRLCESQGNNHLVGNQHPWRNSLVCRVRRRSWFRYVSALWRLLLLSILINPDGIKQTHVPVRPHKFHIQDAHLGVQVKVGFWEGIQHILVS